VWLVERNGREGKKPGTSREISLDDVKPVVSESEVRALLREHFNEPVTGLEPIAGGLIAQTFTFSAADADYVIRFNTDDLTPNFEKEEYVARHFRSPQVPIPEVVRIGRLGELHYCITRKVVGERMDRLSPEGLERALPSVVETLIAIHDTNVNRQKGYGMFDGQGHGFFSSWAAHLTHVRDEGHPYTFLGAWHALFETTFLELDVFNRVFARMEGLLGCCPSTRQLVHGDYGFGNLLIENGRVTAVLDWINAMYGDFLYDVAWLDLFDPERGYAELFRISYAEQGIDPPDFDKRLLCYQCHIALDSMRFAAKIDNPDSYRWVKDRILDLI
jgi:hygromycin-B 4-O-kinase